MDEETQLWPKGHVRSVKSGRHSEGKFKLFRIQSLSSRFCDLLVRPSLLLCGLLGGVQMDSLRAFCAVTLLGSPVAREPRGDSGL